MRELNVMELLDAGKSQSRVAATLDVIQSTGVKWVTARRQGRQKA